MPLRAEVAVEADRAADLRPARGLGDRDRGVGRAQSRVAVFALGGERRIGCYRSGPSASRSVSAAVPAMSAAHQRPGENLAMHPLNPAPLPSRSESPRPVKPGSAERGSIADRQITECFARLAADASRVTPRSRSAVPSRPPSASWRRSHREYIRPRRRSGSGRRARLGMALRAALRRARLRRERHRAPASSSASSSTATTEGPWPAPRPNSRCRRRRRARARPPRRIASVSSRPSTAIGELSSPARLQRHAARRHKRASRPCRRGRSARAPPPHGREHARDR
jgi:hypothetical protein